MLHIIGKIGNSGESKRISGKANIFHEIVMFLDEENVKAYLQWIQEELQLKNVSDWRLLTRKEIEKHRGKAVLTLHSGIVFLKE